MASFKLPVSVKVSVRCNPPAVIFEVTYYWSGVPRVGDLFLVRAFIPSGEVDKRPDQVGKVVRVWWFPPEADPTHDPVVHVDVEVDPDPNKGVVED